MLDLKKWRRGTRAGAHRVGIAVDGERAAFVALGPPRSGERRRVLGWEIATAPEASALVQELGRFVSLHGLRGATARVTLSPTDYNLKLVERPANVPDAELADATRWLIRDLVEVDVESAAIAVLTIPDQAARARTPHMFVVAARDETVTVLGQVVTGAGLRCAGFEVVESAMLALETSLADSIAAGAMARIDAKSSALILASEGRLFLARPLRIDADALDEAAQATLSAENAANEDEALAALEPLILDVQRSLDYYESEYGRAPATRLSLLPGSIDVSPLAPTLGEALRPLRVEAWALEREFAFEETPPTRDHGLLALACGAAVADESVLAEALIPKRLRAAKDAFGLVRVAQLAATVVLALALWSGHQYRQLARESDALAALATQEQGLADALGAATARAQAEATQRANLDPTALRDQRDALLALLRDLGEPGSAGSARFSTLLMGLARQDFDGVWLDRIEVSDAGQALALHGRTLSARNVPLLLTRLHDEPAFAGRRFGQFAIEREKGTTGPLRFHVATRASGAETDGSPR